MVCREHQDALQDGLAELRAVLMVAERRRHLEVRIVRREVVAAQEEMVRGRLGGHRQPLALGGADEANAFGGGNVLDMQPAAGRPADREVPADRRGLDLDAHHGKIQLAGERTVADDAALEQRRIHRMLADADAELGAAFHRPLHRAIVPDIRPVVREERGSGRGKGVEVRRLDAAASAGDADGGKQHDRALRKLRLLPLVIHQLRRVAGGLRVGHGDDRGESSALGRGKAARRRFRGRHARIAEMDVDVNEPGECKFVRHPFNSTIIQPCASPRHRMPTPGPLKRVLRPASTSGRSGRGSPNG